MTARSQRADASQQSPGAADAAPGTDDHDLQPGFDQLHWEESHAEREMRGAGGRAVLAVLLVLAAFAWVAFAAWSAGRLLASQGGLAAPQAALWVAVLAAPLALLGLVWIMFGRTRRKEAELFTRSVVAMRSEARSLEALLDVLTRRIDDGNANLHAMADRLVGLGDAAAGKLGEVARDLDERSQRVAIHGEALDRAAEAARNDVAVLLDDLPKAEATARAMAEELRAAGEEASRQSKHFEGRLADLGEGARLAEGSVASSVESLVSRLKDIEQAGGRASEGVIDAEQRLSSTIDTLLDRAAAALVEIRSGVDAQGAAVAALVDQAEAGLSRAGFDAAETLGAHIGQADSALNSLEARIREQQAATQRLAAEAAEALGAIDRDFDSLATRGDQRTAALVDAVARARSDMMAIAGDSESQLGSIDELKDRSDRLRATVSALGDDIRDRLLAPVNEAQEATGAIGQSAAALRPELEWMRDAANEADTRLATSAAGIADQQDRLASLLASLQDGTETATGSLASLASAIAETRAEADRMSGETGPALLSAMVQVREAASHAADRAREAIASIIPDSVENLSVATRDALESAIRDGIEDRLRAVEDIAAKAVDSARAASERLTQQMLNLGQSAAALERHVEETEAAQRERDSEAFARRVAMLIDSMHSAAIDVGKILADEVDEKAWDAYLKGDRGIFTRRAVRLLDGAEVRTIRSHYENDREFQQSVNRYVHDFEVMLRRILAERDGGVMAVTLMSSDMGKLYAALAEAIDRRI